MYKYHYTGYIDSIPSIFFEGAVYTLLLCFVISVAITNIKKGFRVTFIAALLEYILLLYSSTIFSRAVQIERKFNFRPLWTYEAILEGEKIYVAEVIMNVVAFIPIGLLLGCSFPSTNWKKVLITACLLSVSVEVLQFCMMRGFSELDDVIHNTLGCIIGYGLYSLIRLVYEKVSKRNETVL